MEMKAEATASEDAAEALTIQDGWLEGPLNFIWDNIVVGDGQFNPEKSCYALADQYRHSGKTLEECAHDFINWQTGKAGAAGFALGLPGGFAMALTIPADFTSVSYLQLRMIAVIGLLFGWDPKSDQLRTLAFGALLGTVATEAVRDVSVKASTRLGTGLVKSIPGTALRSVNRFLHVPNLFIKGVGSTSKAAAKPAAGAAAKAGSKGLVNLTKMVPVLGGIVGGGLNIVFTRQMGLTALEMLKNGPPDRGASHAAGNAEEHQTIDGFVIHSEAGEREASVPADAESAFTKLEHPSPERSHE